MRCRRCARGRARVQRTSPGRRGTKVRPATFDFRIAFSVALRSRSRSLRCRRPDGTMSEPRAPRGQWTAGGDFHFGLSKLGWGAGGSGLPSLPHCHCLIVQDPGELGAKAPSSPLSFIHFPFSIFRFRAYRRKVFRFILSGLPAEGVGGDGAAGVR